MTSYVAGAPSKRASRPLAMWFSQLRWPATRLGWLFRAVEKEKLRKGDVE